MLRGISSSGHFGQAMQCVINAFDTYYLMSADEVMANILHLAQKMDEDAGAPSMPAPNTSPPPISSFVAACRGSHRGRGHNPRGPRGGRGRPYKCSACGSLDHIMSSYNAPDDALLKRTLAKRKMIVQKYGTLGGSASAHAALQSDVLTNESHSLPTLEDCTDEYDDTEVSVPFSFVAFSSSITPPGRDLSQYWVVDSACSINLTAFRKWFLHVHPTLDALSSGWSWCRCQRQWFRAHVHSVGLWQGHPPHDSRVVHTRPLISLYSAHRHTT
jgi:hypothetical protein